MENLIYAIILLPLLGFLISGVFGKYLPKNIVGGIATLVVFASFCLAISIFNTMDNTSQPTIIKAFECLK